MKIIDLSIPIEDGLPSDRPQQIPHIQYLNHKDTAQIMTTYFHGGITVDDLPEGNGWAIENLQLTTHSGTHLDAPYHYYPTMNDGEPAWPIDKVPLEWCIGNGVKMDFSQNRMGIKFLRMMWKGILKNMTMNLKKEILSCFTPAQTKSGGRKNILPPAPG